MPDPTVSVLMAVYNGQAALPATIRSTLAQTFDDFEFVIVDDGSTDDTAGVVRSFGNPRIVLHTNETNLGQTASLNVGLKMARGRYVARIDAGDFSLPARLATQVAFMRKRPSYAAVGTSAVMVDPQGKKIGLARRPVDMREVILRMFYVSPLIHISVMMRRETVLAAGGYDEDFHITADHELWSRLIRHGHPVTSLRRALAGYEIDPAGLSYAHLRGKVTAEAAEIVRRNAAALAGVELSAAEAEGIFKLFTFGLDDLPGETVDHSEALFKDILARIISPLCRPISPRAVGRHLVRNYVKLALRQWAGGHSRLARQTLREACRRHGRYLLPMALIPMTLLGRSVAGLLPNTATPASDP